MELKKAVKIFEKGLKILEERVEAIVKNPSLYAVRNVIRSLRGYILGPFIVKKFRNSICRLDNIHDALDFAFSFQALRVSLRPSQVKREIAKLWRSWRGSARGSSWRSAQQEAALSSSSRESRAQRLNS
jgi:hypothetical protein